MREPERIEELKRLRASAIPEGAQAFSEWSDQVHDAISNDGERNRWDYLSTQYKNGSLTNKPLRSIQLLMETLIEQEIRDLEEADTPRFFPPIFWAILAVSVIRVFFLLARETPPSPGRGPSAASPTPKPQGKPQW